MSELPPFCPYETFPALTALPVIHGFTGAVPGVEVHADRATALARLDAYHQRARQVLGVYERLWVTAEQVHGAGVAVVDASTVGPVAGVDALVTNDPAVCLGIYVADCAPVWLVDPQKRVIACVHSGKKGTELGVVPAAIAKMRESFGCEPGDITAQIGPCIRPPHYEVDFAAQIAVQCREAGLHHVHDCMACTATQVGRYYSYRAEKGMTGRMLAIIALSPV